jgi:bifunctional non-homologous end joining protein LigD
LKGPAKRKGKAKPARTTSLKEYRAKRDFSLTSEPKPRRSRAHPTGHQFVVQRHAARRLHFDLRLELGGVLKSWAVTRGPSLVSGEKRLAIHTEDHPLDYLTFEGNIPKGEYGGGTMIVWDRGEWVPDGDPEFGLKKGHLAFTLDGGRLKGGWHLVRIRPKRGEKTDPWLLIKSDDEFARKPGDAEITAQETTSALSGRTSEEVAAAGGLRSDHDGRAKAAKPRTTNLPDISKIRGARKGLLPVFLEPALASICDKPPSGPRWVHEIKYDGYRMQARIDGATIRLLTRKALDWTARFKSVATALRKLNLGSALLDGEIVVEDAAGVSRFPLLQEELSAERQGGFKYYVFDLLYCDGFDLTGATLLDRKALLQAVLDGAPPDSPIRFSEHLAVDGPTMFEHAGLLGLEGIISKRKDLPYRPGRDDHWLKSKCVAQQEFIVVGYIPSTTAKSLVGSLALAYFENKELMYAGRVGTGWSLALAKLLRERLEQLVTTRPKFVNALPEGAEKGVRWVKPALVAVVQFRGWSSDRILRQSAFKGLREDRLPEEVTLEAVPKGQSKKSSKRGVDIGGVALTHPDRLLWDDGLTKQALLEFYADIAEWILPQISGRVLSLLRAPSGTNAKTFFAKHPWPGLSDAVRHIDVGEKQPMLVIDGFDGLASLVQSGVVEIHPWGSRADNLERPDRLIFDLDPGEDVPWPSVIDAARELRDRLKEVGLVSFVKTSGGKGLHVVVPIEPTVSWDEAKAFTERIAEAMSGDRPDRFLANMSKRLRRGRIFVDYLRNGRGATAVAAYSTRARPQAPVSTPISWDDLSEGIRADQFTVGNLRERLDFLKSDPWRELGKVRQKLKVR